MNKTKRKQALDICFEKDETEREKRYSSLPVFPSIDSYFFYIEADHRPFKSGMPDPILNFSTLYSKQTYGPSPISKLPSSLSPPNSGTIPSEYQVLEGGNYLTLKRRVPTRHHHILNTLRFSNDLQTAADWGKFMRELEKNLISAGMTNKERNFFKAKYEFEIEGTEFLFKKTKKLKSQKNHDAFLASIGGMTNYTMGFKENIWNKLRWAQILLHHFQGDIRTYGIHIAFDIPCAIAELIIKANSDKLESTRDEFGTTVYYYFTKSGEKIYLYCKMTKDGGYLPMTRFELVIPKSKIKELGLYDLHRDYTKINDLIAHVQDRLREISITHNDLPIRFPSEQTMRNLVSDFIRGLNGHPYNPCAYNLCQQNFADSCRVLASTLEALKKLNDQEGFNLELDLSLLGAIALENRRKKLRNEANITKEVFNKKVIPYMIGNYHRIAPLRDRQQAEKIKKVNSIQVSKSGIYKLVTGESIFIDTTIQDLITDKTPAEVVPQEAAQIFTNNCPRHKWHGRFRLLFRREKGEFKIIISSKFMVHSMYHKFKTEPVRKRIFEPFKDTS